MYKFITFINYFLEKGIVNIIKESKSGSSEIVATFGPGKCFGELALLYNAPRSATIKSIGKCELWGIDRDTFRKVV